MKLVGGMSEYILPTHTNVEYFWVVHIQGPSYIWLTCLFLHVRICHLFTLGHRFSGLCFRVSFWEKSLFPTYIAHIRQLTYLFPETQDSHMFVVSKSWFKHFFLLPHNLIVRKKFLPSFRTRSCYFKMGEFSCTR
jgi:hypothetical protein